MVVVVGAGAGVVVVGTSLKMSKRLSIPSIVEEIGCVVVGCVVGVRGGCLLRWDYVVI